MRPLPTSASDPGSERFVTRRFYWELAELRRLGGPKAASVLADPRLDAALRALRAIRKNEPLRVACLVELSEHTPVEPLLRARAALARHDLVLDLWPKLEGETIPTARFLNTSTAAAFQARLLPLLDALERHPDGRDIGLALDLEPNGELIRGAWRAQDPDASLATRARAWGSLLRGVVRAVADARQGLRDLAELARDLEARDLPVHVAVLPPLLSRSRGDTWRTWVLGCPLSNPEGQPLFGLQAAMCYAPLARRLPRAADNWGRKQEKRVLALWAARHRTQFDAVVLGQTARGMLGDEPVYMDPKTLAEDVRAMDALEFGDVGLYALEGIFFGDHGCPGSDLRLRPDVDHWIAASFGET